MTFNIGDRVQYFGPGANDSIQLSFADFKIYFG